jgi:3-hydroxybutyryl-CoA dehydrogenase
MNSGDGVLNTVLIIGTGVMGRQVAWACASHGLRTILFDREPAAAASAAAQITGWIESDAGNDAVPPYALEVATDLHQAVSDADMVFENVYEDVDVKKRLYREIEEIDNGTRLIGSNASALSWSALAEGMKWPDRYFLMNFTGPRFSPLAEYMDGAATRSSVRRAALDWARRIGVVAIPVLKDIPGYVQNRIWRAIKKEALFLVDRGYSTPSDVDRGFVLSQGVRFGPFALMDKIGLHSVLRVEQRYYDMTKDPSDRPANVLVKLVESGRLGVVTDGGFYDYPDPAYLADGWLYGAA